MATLQQPHMNELASVDEAAALFASEAGRRFINLQIQAINRDIREAEVGIVARLTRDQRAAERFSNSNLGGEAALGPAKRWPLGWNASGLNGRDRVHADNHRIFPYSPSYPVPARDWPLVDRTSYYSYWQAPYAFGAP